MLLRCGKKIKTWDFLFFYLSKDLSLALWLRNAHCRLDDAYLSCVLSALFLSVLVGVWTSHCLLATVLVSVCVLEDVRLVGPLQETVKDVTGLCVWPQSCAVATWLLTVSFHWRCMLAVFFFLFLFHSGCTRPERSSFVLFSVSSPLTHPLFMFPPLCYTPTIPSRPCLQCQHAVCVTRAMC